MGFFSGAKDNKIIQIDLEGNPMREMTGHSGAVNSLCQMNDRELVSGSWDGTAKVWDLETGQCTKTLEGHSYAVAVFAMADGTIFTGSQDKMIRIWKNGQKVKEWQAHDDIVRGFAPVPGLGCIASCSNDQTVKLWSLDGGHMMDLTGHTAFTFAIDTLDTGEIVSAGDDCVVKVWDGGECKQTIQMPGTVWSVTHNKKGDLIIGCEDKSIRTFTRDKTRQDVGPDFEEYNTDCKKKGQSEQFNADDLLDFSTQVQGKLAGKQDGEIKIFKDKGTVSAYCWKAAENKWEYVGEVQSDQAPQQNTMGQV